MKTMIIGAGGQGAPCASILSRDPDVSEIKLCDIDEKLLQKVKDRISSPKITIAKVNAADSDGIAREAEGMDAIIDLVTPRFFTNMMKGAVKAKTNYVNTAWEEYLFEGFKEKGIQLGSKLNMNDDFVKNNSTAVLGCGMTSGYTTNVIIRYYVDKLDTVESIKIRLAKKDLRKR